MKRLLTASLLFTSILIINSGCDQVVNENEEEENSAITSTASNSISEIPAVLPSFNLLNANGETVDLQSFKGKKVFVNLWATWCPPCRAELPSIEKLYAGTGRNNSEFVMISFDTQFQSALGFAKKSGMKTPVYYPAQQLPDLFNVEGIPVTFIFNEEGKLIKKIEGASRYDTPEYMEMLK